MLFNVNNSYFYYDENNYSCTSDYFNLIVDLIKEFLIKNHLININISLCNNNYHFYNNNKCIKININYEHTIVKKNGRGTTIETPKGILLDENNENYLVRIDNYHELNISDIIIDYSKPNIFNIENCNLYSNFSKKNIYIFPSIYNTFFLKDNRNIPLLTTFININESRRELLINKLLNNHIPHINVNNCFEKNNLQNFYKNTKILVNIHQTEHHNTFEELRVLPALQCGVLCICEISPLKELIPYHDYIIWESYDNLLDKIKEVIDNYDYFFDLIFYKEKNLKLSDFNNLNYYTLKNKIISQL